MRSLLAIAFCMLLALTACGGSPDREDTETGGVETTSAAATDDGASEEESVSDTTEADGDQGIEADTPITGEASTGTVTIGGETYRFADTGSPGLNCDPSSFGVAFIAALQQVDDSGAGVDGGIAVGLPFKGDEETAGITAEMSVSIGEMEWIANSERAEGNDIAAGSSQVDSYQIDGNTVTGTATFYERISSFGGDPMVEQGTFEVTCAD